LKTAVPQRCFVNSLFMLWNNKSPPPLPSHILSSSVQASRTTALPKNGPSRLRFSFCTFKLDYETIALLLGSIENKIGVA
jgi:hypothetical protein